MKQLFKTTLLAATIAAACGNATAGTVTVTKQVHSTEGLSGVTATQTSNIITYEMGAGYLDGDTLTFTFPAGALVGTTFPSEIAVPSVDSDDGSKVQAGMVWGRSDITDTTVSYRVLSVSQPKAVTTIDPDTGVILVYKNKSTAGNKVVLGSIGYKSAALTSASITVKTSAENAAGKAIDSDGTQTATIAEAKTQFGSAVMNTVFDGVINVSAARKAFTVGTSDSMSFTITNPTTTGWLNLATVNASGGTKFTLYGEKDRLMGLKSANFASSGVNTFNESTSSLAVVYSGGVTNDVITFTPPTGADAVILDTQKFSADILYNYTSAGAQAGVKPLGTALPAGEWTLNGATVNIPYMPYGPNASQILYVTNTGSQSGDITATAFDDLGNPFDLGKIAVAKAKTVVKIAPELNAKLAAAGFKGTKLSITITVNAPEDDITVYASYNIGGSDRGFIETSQYKGYNP